MSKKIFVGGLSWGSDEETLREAFGRFGEMDDVRVITDRETGRSRGFGFITFSDDANAAKAVSEMDGSNLDGRTIRVNEAEERRPRSGQSPRTGGGGGGGRW